MVALFAYALRKVVKLDGKQLVLGEVHNVKYVPPSSACW